MKYSSGDILYYVNPFVFFIDVVRIDYAYKEEDGTVYYIDHTGAYLREEELFKSFSQAQKKAFQLLEKFTHECKYNILNNKPQLREEL